MDSAFSYLEPGHDRSKTSHVDADAASKIPGVVPNYSSGFV